MTTRMLLAGLACLTVMTSCSAGSIVGALANTEAGEAKFYSEAKAYAIKQGVSEAVATCAEDEMKKTLTRADIAAYLQAQVDKKEPPSDKVSKTTQDALKLCTAKSLTPATPVK
ncbi:MAG: hypothetical protein H7338_11065 [Candidatus Sericytochromatia bacterium]|nr:hypothetical protein [Candidatus Sericytochromatia bacterium]